MSSVKLIDINVEGNKHWDRIIPFLESEQPDVVCMQEVFDRDVQMLEECFGYKKIYQPITKRQYDASSTLTLATMGQALLTNLPLTDTHTEYYYQAAEEIQAYSANAKRETVHQGIAWGTVEQEGVQYTIASTHFTWTPDGQPDHHQTKDIQSLLSILENIPQIILCGDFNAPRGDNPIYKLLAQRYQDAIPVHIPTTIDVEIHRNGKDPIQGPKLAMYVVDYIFFTQKYSVEDVQVKCGLSDHCAVIANLSYSK